MGYEAITRATGNRLVAGGDVAAMEALQAALRQTRQLDVPQERPGEENNLGSPARQLDLASCSRVAAFCRRHAISIPTPSNVVIAISLPLEDHD